jgi:hypothetical protein
MKTPFVRRLTVGLAVPVALVLGLAACGEDDATQEDLEEELVESLDLTEEQASCVGDRVYGELDQDEINDLAESDNPEEAGEAGEVFTAAVAECITGEG